MQCPKYALKCNKSVHLPAGVSFWCLLGDLVLIWAWFGLGAFWGPLNRSKDIRKTVKRVSEHIYCISVHIRDIANLAYILLMFAGYLWAMRYLCVGKARRFEHTKGQRRLRSTCQQMLTGGGSVDAAVWRFVEWITELSVQRLTLSLSKANLTQPRKLLNPELSDEI